MADLTYAEVDELLKYEPDTGRLFWKPRGIHLFQGRKIPAERCAKIWNSQNAGAEALTARGPYGTRKGAIHNHVEHAHRVAWLLGTGAWPEHYIDHINGDPADNRLVNLRDVTHQVNMRNQKMRSTNKSGVTGVMWSPALQRWRADIYAGRPYHLGYFDTIEEAAAARRGAKVVLGFSARHGEAA